MLKFQKYSIMPIITMLTALFVLSPGVIKAVSSDYTTTSGPVDALALICPFTFIGGSYILICCLQLFILVIGIVGLVMWIWMLIDLMQRNPTDFPSGAGSDAKTLWLVILLLTGSIGSIIYYFMIYRVNPPKNVVVINNK
jgi:hypothetical protein